ncbi:MAG: hypothetical protein A2W86_10020 [Bacteroidetes bacterium GWD2_45_23]|nr:MAG: hypothetical protein A2W87_08850 [Bacteroidetes bacterium GWC2_46_850]OFX84481.1 MAG: hypothetical protein A2W86_10020 [Bacteroidetes bacterium GWD2_45_23]HBA99625.1 DUF3943 domain-containing protein [Porphyromonadaceae bacterium]
MKTAVVIYFVLLSLSLYGQGLAGNVVAIPANSTEPTSSVTYGHVSGHHDKVAIASDSTIVSFSAIEKKRGKAVSINVGLNMAMRGFNRIVLEDEYAQINLRSMRNNINTLPVWDTNRFTTNLIGHPYHGSMYFNSARANGFEFDQSSLVTAAGSLMWEYLMETKPPSHNDLWATTVGGAALGEVLFRLSDLILDNRTTGLARAGRELLAGILSPTRLITRLTTGEAWKTGQSKGNFLYSPPYLLELYLGETMSVAHNPIANQWSTTLGTGLQYGERFEILIGKPYEWFRATGEAMIGNEGFYLTQVNTLGLLVNKKLFQNRETWVTGGLFQHFNYYDVKQKSGENRALPLYISEAASIGPGVIVYQKKNEIKAQFEAYLSGIILGASTSDHFKLEDRDYNFGSGFSLKLNSLIQFTQKLQISLFAENYMLFSWKGVDDYDMLKTLTMDEIDFLNVQGDKSNVRLHLLGLHMKYHLNAHTHLIFRARHFSRNTVYKYFPRVNSNSNEVFLGIGVFV